ncbi:hypothetical protein BH23CHL2_BH23CHL2_23630 [soil metagenome]
MITAVFDANVMLSGFIGLARPEQSAPGALMRHLERRSFQMALSDEIITEVEEAFENRYFRDRIDAETQQRLIQRTA